MKIRFFSNGMVMAFDEHGEQMPEVQAQSWLNLYLDWLKSQGYNLDEIQFTLADGSPIQLHTTSEGRINWTVLR